MAEQLLVGIERLTPDTIARHLSKIAMHPDALKRLVEAVDRQLLFFVAKRQGTDEVVGQVGINPNSPTRQDTKLHIPYPTPAIAFMHVATEYRRHGVGGRLLQEACQVAAAELGATSVYLTVAKENNAAQALYGHYGFKDWEHGTIEMPQFDQAADGTWPAEPTVAQMNVLIKPL